MNSDLLARVLTIEEVKQRMKDIRTTALHYGGVIHAGERGRDEIVILSAKTWEEVSTRKPDETSAADVPSDPYTVFARAIAAGRLGSGPDAPESRRRMRELADENEFSLGEMVRMAGPEEGPPRRRRSE